MTPDFQAVAERLVGHRPTEIEAWAHKAKVALVRSHLIDAYQAGYAAAKEEDDDHAPQAPQE